MNISNLTPGTKYYVRAYAINDQGTTYGEQKDFTTAATLPTVVTGDISGTTAHGEVTDAGGAIVTERGICWGTSHNPTTAGTHGSSGTGTGTFSVELTDLAPGTTYYVRAYATNSAGTAYGSEKTLTTQATLPTVTTGEVSNITQTTAQGSGNVTNSGGANVTERGVCWGTSHNPTISGSHANNGTGTGGFTVNMTGLTANTHYYVRAYAKNSAGVSYGNEVDFTTSQNISTPTVTTSQVTNIAQTTATGGGNVTNSGGATVTERGICWSTSHNPTTSGSHANSGTGTGSFTVNMTGLTANTTYYVRAYAINSAGTSYGSEVSFTTQQTTTYTITVSASPTNGGTVSGGGTYQQGQSCTVHATANNGCTFSNWTENGNVVSTNASYSFTVNGNRSLVANFNTIAVLLEESFEDDLGGFVAFSVLGEQVWHQSIYQGNGYAIMSGYGNGFANVNEDWLISPVMSIYGYSEIIVEFKTAKKYVGDPLQVKVSSNYDGHSNPTNFIWVDISSLFAYSQGNYEWENSGQVNIRNYITGNTYYIAFIYTCSDETASSWEVDDVSIQGE